MLDLERDMAGSLHFILKWPSARARGGGAGGSAPCFWANHHHISRSKVPSHQNGHIRESTWCFLRTLIGSEKGHGRFPGIWPFPSILFLKGRAREREAGCGGTLPPPLLLGSDLDCCRSKSTFAQHTIVVLRRTPLLQKFQF